MNPRHKDMDFTRAWETGVFATHCGCVVRRFNKGEKFPYECPDERCGMRVAWQIMPEYSLKHDKKPAERRFQIKGPPPKQQ